jgi:nitrite reductase/ring-hydroxylating ferredoxin subunit
VKVGADGYATIENTGELKVDQMMLIHADGQRIVLARTEESLVAFDDSCTHKGGPLADGVMACGTVQCPWHGSQFDVNDGSVQAGPSERPIKAYEVDQSGGKVRIAVATKKTKTTVKSGSA